MEELQKGINRNKELLNKSFDILKLSVEKIIRIENKLKGDLTEKNKS